MATQGFADFGANYISTNLASDAPQYDDKLFKTFIAQLGGSNNDELKGFELAILSAILCGLKRADIVPALFRSVTENQNDEDTLKVFYLLKESLSLTFPFVGLPNCIPACLGLVRELKLRKLEPTSSIRRRLFQDADWFAEGERTRKTIYKSVGNPEVHEMVAAYFPDISYAADASIFGFLIAGSLDLQKLERSELVVASAITGVGASRQSRSHCKAAIGVGNTVTAVESMVQVASQIATWNKTPLPVAIDVKALAREVEAELQRA